MSDKQSAIIALRHALSIASPLADPIDPRRPRPPQLIGAWWMRIEARVCMNADGKLDVRFEANTSPDRVLAADRANYQRAAAIAIGPMRRRLREAFFRTLDEVVTSHPELRIYRRGDLYTEVA